MKFFLNPGFRQRILLFAIGLIALALLEYAFLVYRMNALEKMEETRDFTRSTQIQVQNLAFLTNQRINGNGEAEVILFRLKDVDRRMEIISKGGRVDGTPMIIEELPYLPSITFSYLSSSWKLWRSTVEDITEAEEVSAPMRTAYGAQWLELSSWFEKLEADLEEENERNKALLGRFLLVFSIFDILAILVCLWFLSRRMLAPVLQITEETSSQSVVSYNNPDELGQLSSAINTMKKNLETATQFVSAVAGGKPDVSFEEFGARYEKGTDPLKDALVDMQTNIRRMSEEEKLRQWANEGLTKFVDILRSSNDNIHQLGDRIISTLVHYTNSNQGGLYILNDEEPNNQFIELISLFAFDIKKFEKQRIRPGEGLLGQTFLEKETTLLNQAPDEYIRITSGLGGANPKSILIVPLKVDQDVYGLVELASFDEYQEHEVSFVEKLAETIASTLASVKAAQRNRHLIEQFQEQSEVMRSQEEEMRQNMEELQATQEEMVRKERDYVARIEELQRQVESVVPAEEFERQKASWQKKEAELHQLIRDLKEKAEKSPDTTWGVLDEVEKMLRMQAEALKIATEATKKG